MRADCELIGKDLFLRDISFEDCGPAYVGWLNNPDVTRHLVGVRNHAHTTENVRNFIEAMIKSDTSIAFAITERQTGRHVGNIKLGPIDNINNSSQISLFIGETDCWGKGYATQAINLAVSYGFSQLALNRIEAGVVRGNQASLKAFLRNGFTEEGVMRKAFKFEGEYQDNIWLGILSDEWRAHEANAAAKA